MDLDSHPVESPPNLPHARRVDAKRIAVGVAGAVALLLAATVTFGGALVAAIGMGIGSAIARERGKQYTRTSSWISAVVAVGVVLIGFFGVQAARVDAGTAKAFRQALDSSQAHPPPPPPAWLERIAPGAAARANARATPPNPKLTAAIGIWAIVVGTAMVAALGAFLIGSVGWLSTLPVAYAITGRWIGSPAATD